MSCISIPKVPAPDLSLLIPSFDISIGIPTIGLDLCCKLSTPPIPLPDIPVAAIFALLATASGAILDTILALIDSIVDLINSLIDLIPPVNCPLDN